MCLRCPILGEACAWGRTKFWFYPNSESCELTLWGKEAGGELRALFRVYVLNCLVCFHTHAHSPHASAFLFHTVLANCARVWDMYACIWLHVCMSVYAHVCACIRVCAVYAHLCACCACTLAVAVPVCARPLPEGMWPITGNQLGDGILSPKQLGDLKQVHGKSASLSASINTKSSCIVF